jgi:hypothetical protein
VSYVLCNSGGDAAVDLSDVHLATGTWDYVNTQFWGQELSVCSRIVSRSHFVD